MIGQSQAVTILLIGIFLPLIPLSSAIYCQVDDFKIKNDEYARCVRQTTYLTGIKRGADDGLSAIESGKCCSLSSPYIGQFSQCKYANWMQTFQRNNNMNTCPDGFFLHGFYRGNEGDVLDNIEFGTCCKPSKHPYYNGECYEQDVSDSFGKEGLSECKAGFFMTGLQRGSCNKLSCIDKFKCCKMAPKPSPLTSLSDVKTRVMDVTMDNLANLAHFLGYGWCYGCRAEYIGEDFKRSGDSWIADKSDHCSGYMHGRRLKMNYGDFKFSVKDIKYGKAVTQTLEPVTVDSGSIYNDDPHPTENEVAREIQSVRSVSHEASESWTKSHELGIEINYSPPAGAGFGGSVSYAFGYEKSDSKTDSTSNEQSNVFKLTSKKTLEAKTAAKYQITLTKTRSTMSYTATIIAHFSAELEGFLRWGKGRNGKMTNYHNDHRGSEKRPQFKYRFGDAETPFYTALKVQSTENKLPWLWSDMKANHPKKAQQKIDALVDEGRYEFLLTGKFEDVLGQHAEIRWEAGKLDKRGLLLKRIMNRKRADPPKVNPPPPKVDIKTKNFEEVAPDKVPDPLSETKP